MKQYVIDEFRIKDWKKIQSLIDDAFGPPKMKSIYWIYLDRDILTDVQAKHTDCQPFYFAIELVPEKKISCELLVRAENKIRCFCIHYATEIQRNWLIKKIDSLLYENGIIL